MGDFYATEFSMYGLVLSSFLLGEFFEALAPYPWQVPDAFSFQVGSMLKFDQPMPLLEGNIDVRLNNFQGSSRWTNILGIEKREPVWQRLKWTDEMVKLLITAVSYVDEDALSTANINDRRKQFIPLVKDKFNVLNKKYKRLNEMLGRNNACEVVANPVVMERMNISDEMKEKAKKILTFMYESKDVIQAAAKRQKLQKDHAVVNIDGPKNYVDCTGSDPQSPKDLFNENFVLTKGVEGEQEEDQRLFSCSLQLKKKMLQIQGEMLELEKKKFNWLKLSQEADRELIKMKQENELMRLDNKRMAFELTCLEMDADRK
ncbi:Hypothetical predicted protein [Olea europaea subsp. europaea]|uniref:Uncharacterized protein n=1 Tax=Olea europaea subsp. europaea TaxID=158383 RepID=A0A8S0P8E2_OLEEU|nr:Hypothetical predicted protein [Olea europaea subsp. europaea]